MKLAPAAVALVVSASTAAGREKPPLRWGLDATGGAPFVFDNFRKGFELELAGYLADKLGRTSTPVNGEWNKLPELLDRGDLDLVLNGYEWSEQFRDRATVPYFVYKLALTVPAADGATGWDALRGRDGRPGKRVGVLTGSAAARYVEKEFGDGVRVQVFDDVANTFALVASGQLDATVQDSPAATFYVAADAARLRRVDEARAPGYYVMLTRPADVALRDQLNTAVRTGLQDGTLERIYRKYGLWTDDQQRLWYLVDHPPGGTDPAAVEHETAATPIDWPLALRLLGRAALTTVELAVLAMPLAMGLGLLIAAGRLYGPGWLGPVLAGYVEVFRGTPLLLQLWVLFYLLPRVVPAAGQLDPLVIGVLGLALNYAASEAEHFRAGFQNLPRGQMEAALALGLTPGTAVRRVLAPQAVRAAIPSVTNDFVALFKDTAVCSVIAVMELTKQYNTLYNNHRDHILTLAALTAGLYLLMSYPLALVARRAERRLAVDRRRA